MQRNTVKLSNPIFPSLASLTAGEAPLIFDPSTISLIQGFYVPVVTCLSVLPALHIHPGKWPLGFAMPPREAGARKRSHTKPLQQFFVTRSTRFLFPPLENNESVLRSAQKRVHMQLFSKSNWIKRSQITVQGLCSTLLWHRHEICLTYNEIGLCSPRFSLLSFAPSAPARSLTERLTCTDVIGKRRFAKQQWPPTE